MLDIRVEDYMLVLTTPTGEFRANPLNIVGLRPHRSARVEHTVACAERFAQRYEATDDGEQDLTAAYQLFIVESPVLRAECHEDGCVRENDPATEVLLVNTVSAESSVVAMYPVAVVAHAFGEAMAQLVELGSLPKRSNA
jgi:hypothetical protein